MRNLIGKKNVNKQELIYNLNPHSPIVEAYRNLRTNLNYLSPDKELKKISFTSSEPGDGKSLTITNLAISMANNGQKVILIDGDLRRPKVHTQLNVTSFDGVSDILSGKISFDEALRDNEVDNLYVIPSGAIPPNPSELISSQKMSELLDKAAEKADIVLVDAPPVGISDSAIIGNKVDGTIIVVHSHKTKEEQIKDAKMRLKKSNSNILGTVLNMHPIEENNKYYGGYYTQ
ncbi:CpsD/CapB family tyrosine-protein kinase [Halanaerobiaceae bacterium Z-7014]|uniref:non-specific protein-tyrosine kinase n=1 Tax=Halonatronomonas betaini TaxID=2778430 RepID=A0A931ATM8_9FIRM|nr:CpsD/CapB family tyrosine-protein kinase [Halonatronomonas betaini]MBF8436575.1 CpsD/CapB family tyrosine-protein kinase [Halonatronomonas betaini]